MLGGVALDQKLEGRIERELGELADLAERKPARAGDGVAVQAIGPAAPAAPEPASPAVVDEEAAK